MPLLQTPESYRENLAQIGMWAVKAGRKAEEVEAGLVLPIGVSESYDLVERNFLPLAKVYVSYDPEFLKKHGFTKIY